MRVLGGTMEISADVALPIPLPDPLTHAIPAS
jgi:hypothetical protein